MEAKQNVEREFQFILDCCKSFSFYNAKSQFESIKFPESLNEETLYLLLQRHRILPLVSLFILNSNLFSESFKKSINIEFSSNQLLALKNKRFEFLFEEFLVTSNIFGFAFKGLSLANDYYGDIAMRQVYDVDLYVEQSSLQKAHEWLLNLGYREHIGYSKLTTLQKKYIVSTGHDLSYFTDDKNLPALVELHWRLKEGLGGFSLEPKGKLNQVDEFLYLCVHGTEHAWFRLKWLCDILQIIKYREFDWDEVRERAVELNCTTHLSITWLILNRFFQNQIPSQILNQIDKKHYKSKINFISEVIFLDVPYRTSRIGKLTHLMFLTSLNAKKISLINFSKYLTSHNDWELIKVPDFLFFVYFLLRPFLWIYRGLLALFR